MNAILRMKEKFFKFSTRLPFNYYDLICRFTDRDTYTILDVGCGNGSTTEIILKCLRARRLFVVGIDCFTPWLKQCQEQKSHNALVLGDARLLPFRKKSFDTVYCLEVLEHLPKNDALKVIEKCEKLARKQLIISTPVGIYYQEETDNNPWQRHRSFWKPEEFRELGFKVRGRGLGRLWLRKGHPVSGFRELFAFSISYLGFPLPYFVPKLAFQMICVYNT